MLARVQRFNVVSTSTAPTQWFLTALLAKMQALPWVTPISLCASHVQVATIVCSQQSSLLVQMASIALPILLPQDTVAEHQNQITQYLSLATFKARMEVSVTLVSTAKLQRIQTVLSSALKDNTVLTMLLLTLKVHVVKDITAPLAQPLILASSMALISR